MADIAQLERALIKADAAGDAEAAKAFAGEIRRLRASPTEAKPKLPAESPSLLREVGQSAGNLVAGAVRGAGSIGATLLWPVDKATDMIKGDRGPSLSGLITGTKPLSRNEERRQAMDDGLETMGAQPDSFGYGAGKLVGEIAGTAGAGGLIGQGVVRSAPLLARAGVSAQAVANTSSALATGGFRAGTATGKAGIALRVGAGATSGGVSAGMTDPRNAGPGALIGGALPPVLKGLGKAGSLVGRSFAVGDANRELARQAVNQYGIPLGIGDIAEGGTIKAVRSLLNDAPFSGGLGAAQREATQEGFNSAVGGTFGAPAKKLTASVVDAAKKRMGEEFDRIWNSNSLQVDADMMRQLIAMQKQAAKLPKNEGASLTAEINDILGKMVPDQSGATIIPGDVANKFQSYLRRRAEGSAGMRYELGDLRQSIISAFNRGIRQEDAAALTMNRGQYKAFKTVEPLLNGAEAGVAGRMAGDVPAALLPSAVARQYPQAAGVPLADLSKIGSRFIVDRTAKTGGSTRAAIQNSLVGGAIMGAGFTNPLLAAGAIPGAVGVNALLGSSSFAKLLLAQGQPNRLMQLIGPQAGQLGYRAAPLLTDQ